MKRVIFGALFAAALIAQITLPSYKGVLATGAAFTYYVSPTGADGNPGTLALPWQTIAKVNATTLTPGQSVGFKRGGTWRETLTPGQSGSAGSPITFAAYGSGAKPVISGSDSITSWAQGAGALVQETCTGSCRFASGFETGGSTFSDWTSHNSVDIPVTQISTTSAHGAFSMRLGPGTTASGNRANVSKSIPALILGNTYYFRWYMYIPTGAIPAGKGIKLLTLGGGNLLYTITTNGTGVINGGNLNGYSVYGSASVPNTAVISNWTMDAWNTIEIAYKVSATVGGGQAWINGVSVGSNFTANTSGATVVASLLLGNDNYDTCITNGAFLYFDDFQMNTVGPIGSFTGTGVPNTVWSSTVTTQPNSVFVNALLGSQQAGYSSLFQIGDWYWTGSTLYVYNGSGGAPTDIQASSRNYALDIGAKSYITTNGLDFTIGQIFATNINTNGTGINIQNSLITGQVGVFKVVSLSISPVTVNLTLDSAVTSHCTVAAWGDSLTGGTGGGGTTWPAVFASLTNCSAYNGGVPGETSTQIKARMVADGSKSNYTVVIWAGRNNYSAQSTVLADDATMLASLTRTKRYLMLSILNGDFGGEYSGGGAYGQIVGLNAALAAAYPANYLDIRTLLVSQYDSGNAQDVIDHGHDVPPSSIRNVPTDQIHLNGAGYTYVGKQVAAWLVTHD